MNGLRDFCLLFLVLQLRNLWYLAEGMMIVVAVLFVLEAMEGER